ncbi:MAG: SpoIIE family protein phosphatase, partial [Bacteroidia bacterium]|nr:SpoIIE family protein phosphatase [Bacteroidia bacterium]
MSVIEEPIDSALVKSEFYKNTERFHVMACWIGITLNIVWFASDYFVLPDHWKQFVEWRFAVSLIATIALVFRKKIGLNVYQSVFILVLGISIQNSYMWSVMDLAHMQKHAFAYMVLFIGVGMLILWEFWYSIALVVLSVVTNIVFYKLYSPLSVEEFTINGGLLILTVAIFMIGLIRTRYRLTVKEITSRLALERSKQIIEKEHETVVAQNKEIEMHKDELEEKNKEITDSINYAKRIQTAFIPSEKIFTSHFPDSFVYFKPKDIVSGDFYWIAKKNDRIFYVTADCTGHGVPGGFMTMLGLSFLEEIIEIKGEMNTDAVVNYLRDRIVTTLKQGGDAGESKDGMDLAVCCVDKEKRRLTYSAANNSIYIARNGELLELKPDKQPCGFYHEPKPFTKREVQLESNDIIYSFTDGYADQFGGKQGKKFRYKALETILLE